jgi:CRISPR-associated protein Csx1
MLELQRFKINGHMKTKLLSSFALKEYLRENGDDVKVVLVYPVSLPLNTAVQNANFNDRDFLERINDVICTGGSEYLQNTAEFFEKMPYSSESDDFFVVHSTGEYAGVQFDGKFNDIVFEIALDMMERYIAGEVERIYVDISSGLNIFVSAILEAVRFFSTWAGLRNWVDTAKRPEIRLAFSDPILGGVPKEYEIHQEKIEFKAFFTSPINKDDLDNIGKKIYELERQKKQKLKELLERFAIIFSAIKNNIPLAVYHFGFHSREEIGGVFEQLLADMRLRLYASYKESPGLEKTSYSKAILTLGFYAGLAEVLDFYGFKIYDRNKGVSMNEIKEKFNNDMKGDVKNKQSKGVYDLFDIKLNRVFLGSEISNLEKKLENAAQDAWQLIVRFFDSKDKIQTPDKRNFFAHSGLEGLITEIKKTRNELFVRYAEEFTDSNGGNQSIEKKIKTWLIEEV